MNFLEQANLEYEAWREARKEELYRGVSVLAPLVGKRAVGEFGVDNYIQFGDYKIWFNDETDELGNLPNGAFVIVHSQTNAKIWFDTWETIADFIKTIKS